MSKFVRLLFAGCFLLVPPAVVSLTLGVRLGATLLDCGPNRTDQVFNDEVSYWNEVATFRRAGFDGGYFVINERPARASWTHFGPHGPAYPAIYGTLAKVFGWQAASGPVFNVFALLGGSVAWLALCRPDGQRLLAATAVMATFWPCLLFVPATMQEILHCAIAIVLAGIARRVIDADRVTIFPAVAFVVAAAMASLVRITWALVLIPLAVTYVQRSKHAAKAFVIAATAALIAALWLVSQWICAPYPNELSALVDAGRDLPGRALRIVFTQIERATREILSPRATAMELLERAEICAVLIVGVCSIVPVAGTVLAGRTPVRRSDLFIMLNVLLFGLLAVLQLENLIALSIGPYLFAAANAFVIAGLVALHRHSIMRVLRWLRGRLTFCVTDRPACLFAAIPLALTLVGVLVLYGTGSLRDYRVLAPNLLFALLLLASGPGWRFSLGVAAVNLLFVVPFVQQFEEFHRERVVPREVIDLAPVIDFDPVSGPWGNTLLVPNMLAWPRLSVPAGIGISFVADSPYRQTRVSTLRLPPRSRYLLLDSPLDPSWQACRLKLIQRTPAGDVYRNLDFQDDLGPATENVGHGAGQEP